MEKIIELSNIEINEYCELDIYTGEKKFYNTKKIAAFTGLYSKGYAYFDHFFGIYPTKDGPTIYFEGREYKIDPSLDIQVSKKGKAGKFKIVDYNIEIDYLESEWIGWDVFSDEIDVDLFFMIEQRYKKQEFYDQYTLKS